MNQIFAIAVAVVGIVGALLVLTTCGEYGRWTSFGLCSVWGAMGVVLFAWGLHNHLTGTFAYPWKAGGAAVSGGQIMAGSAFMIAPALWGAVQACRKIKRESNQAGGR